MSTETVNILALILGFLGVVLYILVFRWLSKRTDKLIKSLDEKAKAIMRRSG